MLCTPVVGLAFRGEHAGGQVGASQVERHGVAASCLLSMLYPELVRNTLIVPEQCG